MTTPDDHRNADRRNDSPDASEDSGRIVVVRGNVQGIPVEEYAAALRGRIDGYTVEYARTPAEERELLPDADIVTGKYLSEEQVSHMSSAELFACATAGIDHLPVDELRERGIAVTNGSGIHTPNATEHVFDVLLTLVRGSKTAWKQQQRNHWEVYQPRGRLAGKTATVVGLGPIGRSIAERFESFDVRTIGVRYSPEKGGPTDEVIGFDREAFHDALARSDVVVLACPLSETTENLVGETELFTLPPDAFVVNIARGEVLDTDALVEALRHREIRGAALDATNPEPLPESHPLWNFEDVIITPHVAGFSADYWEQLADILARNIERIRETGEYTDLENQVSLTE